MWYVNFTNELLADSDAHSFILTMWYVNPAILIETCFVSNKFYINYVVCKFSLIRKLFLSLITFYINYVVCKFFI